MTRLLKLILLSLPVFVSCEREPRLSPLQDSSQFSPYQRVSTIPIILVGRIIANSKIGQSHTEKHDHALFIRQMFRLTIAVENVLKGDVALGNIEVYYFTNLGPIGGTSRLGMQEQVPGGRWQISDRAMFFLQPDSGVIRTICDVSDVCVLPVFSGAHPDFRLDASKPLSHTIIDILLSRGTDCGDQQMMRAISETGADLFSWDYAIAKLRRLALTETPPVRKQACETLGNLGNPCPEI